MIHNKIRIFYFTIFLTCTISLHAQTPVTTSQNNYGNYTFIKNIINSGNLYEAEKQINFHKEKDPSSAALTLLQVEVWIERGNREFNKGNYKNAFPYYEKSLKAWPGHPFVRERYNFLSGKILTNKMETTEPNAKTDQQAWNETLQSLQTELQEIKLNQYYLKIGLGILTFFVVSLLIGIIILWRKLNEETP